MIRTPGLEAFIAALLSGLLALASSGCARRLDSTASWPQRIVSLAPSTTEVLFALGLGRRVVGVTRFCNYPPETASIAKVGGYVDPNYEEIVALEPDLAILLPSHRDARLELQKLHIRTLVTPQDTVADIRESIRLIGAACGVPDAAQTVLADLERRTRAVGAAVRGRSMPRVLVCLGRDGGAGRIDGVYVAGRDTFYGQLVEIAGGVNASGAGSTAYPYVSAEGLFDVDPDVIIDLAAGMRPAPRVVDAAMRQWRQLWPIAAVHTGRVHVISGDHALRPGPRYIQFLEELARALHPDAFEKAAAHD
jgi:iron complex transport system substrate-binding protein